MQAVVLAAVPEENRVLIVQNVACAVAAQPSLKARSPGDIIPQVVPVGLWRSWERASMASRRSWVRIPSAPPNRRSPVIPRFSPNSSRQPPRCALFSPRKRKFKLNRRAEWQTRTTNRTGRPQSSPAPCFWPPSFSRASAWALPASGSSISGPFRFSARRSCIFLPGGFMLLGWSSSSFSGAPASLEFTPARKSPPHWPFRSLPYPANLRRLIHAALREHHHEQ
jgi:hypothetical protein